MMADTRNYCTCSSGSGSRGKTLRLFGSRTTALRILFLASLAAAAGICGYVAYAMIEGLEDEVAVQTYESVAIMALHGAQQVIHRKVGGNDAIASLLSYAFPNASQWPFVGMAGFETMASKVADLSGAMLLGYAVIVQPAQVEEFEAYAQQFYQTNGYPESAGQSDFGFGIFSLHDNNNNNDSDSDSTRYYSDGRYHDTTGQTSYGNNNYSLLCPIFQTNQNDAESLMFNIHSEVFLELESILECSKLPITTNTNSSSSSSSPPCSVVTNFAELMIRPGPAALVYQPIYPQNDPTTVVGITGTSIHWEEVLMDIVPEYVQGLHCVIFTHSATYTYVIDGGKPILLGPGDLHDPDYTKYGKSMILNDIRTNASASVPYTLTVYPTTVMLGRFNTSSPLRVSLGFVGVLLFCASLFILYDCVVQSKSRQREVILDMKRRFVRFLSHEMRTPLNTVCMGLDLLQQELQNQLVDLKQKKEPSGTIDHDDDDEDSIDPLLVTRVPSVYNNNDNDTGDSCDDYKNASYWLDLTGDILENSHNAVSVLNDLLNYDKIEAGKFSIELAVVPIWSLIQKTTAEFQIQAKNRKVDLRLVLLQQPNNKPKVVTTDVESADTSAALSSSLGQFHVIGDDMKLSQVIRNLVSNALKFTPPNGTVTVSAVYIPGGLPDAAAPITGKTKTTTKPLETMNTSLRVGSIQITVDDTGEGMTGDQLRLLFSEGVQFNANQLQAGGGSGLGLCITKEIVQQHGGTIVATSRGRRMGSTFTVELPLFQIPAVESDIRLVPQNSGENKDGILHNPEHMGVNSSTEHEMKREVSSSDQSTSQQHHILVVDDVVSNRKMLVRLLERRGYTCVTAKDGQEALDVFIANKASVEAGNTNEVLFDTILMDFEMPIMDGPEATRRIRAVGCQAAIFGVTGNVLARDVALFKASGADHVIPKPVNLSLLDACWANLRMMDPASVNQTNAAAQNKCSSLNAEPFQWPKSSQ